MEREFSRFVGAHTHTPKNTPKYAHSKNVCVGNSVKKEPVLLRKGVAERGFVSPEGGSRKTRQNKQAHCRLGRRRRRTFRQGEDPATLLHLPGLPKKQA